MENSNRHTLVFLAIAAIGFLALMVFAVKSNEDATDGGGATDLNGTSWTVESLVFAGEAVPSVPGTTLTADFADGEVTGSAGCNNYFGSFEQAGDTVTFGPLGATRKFCPDPPGVNEQESAYLAVLGASERFSIDGDRLTIDSSDTGQVVYVQS